MISKLFIAVVQSEDAPSLIRRLSDEGHRVTRIDTSGGFLQQVNAVLLIGLSEQDISGVMGTIQEMCHTRTTFTFPPAGNPAIGIPIAPLEIEVGGAVVFSLPIERHCRLMGRRGLEDPDLAASSTQGERPDQTDRRMAQ